MIIPKTEFSDIQVRCNKLLIPFKSTTSGRVTPRGYADPERMLVKSFIPFRVSRPPLNTIIENGKRETGNGKVTNTIDAPFYGPGQCHVF